MQRKHFPRFRSLMYLHLFKLMAIAILLIFKMNRQLGELIQTNPLYYRI